ncbi:MAG: hypothetical protein KDB14_09020 [Planctomycetales bacterium]|nr:hypothetical protein [Planctomycetales bacterium]
MCLMCLVGTLTTACADTPEQQAEAALLAKGLSRRGATWELADEALLRRRLSQLERMQTELFASHRTLPALIQENQTHWGQLGRQVESLEKKLKSLSTNHADRPKLERQLAQLQRTVAPPNELSRLPALRTLAKQQLARELDILVKTLWCRAALSQLREQQPQLARDPEVKRHLSQLGGALSTLEAYRDSSDLLTKCEDLVLVPHSTIYQEGGHWRLGVIVNDTVPLTVSWMPRSNDILLASGVAATCKARIDESRRQRQLEVEKDRVVTATPIVLTTLRFGSQAVENVPAWRLPPEAADLGSRLGERAVDQWKVSLHPERLQAEVRRSVLR